MESINGLDALEESSVSELLDTESLSQVILGRHFFRVDFGTHSLVAKNSKSVYV